MRKYIVYSHKCIDTGKVYIGVTSLSTKARWGVNGNNYNGCTYFYNAIQKYGWDHFEHIILYEDLTREEAFRLEKHLIKKYKELNKSYNIACGGGGISGYKHSQEIKELLSQKRKGIKYSEQTLRRMSESHKGKRLSEQAKAKISKPVIQLDLNGNIIARWKSIAEACRVLGFKSKSKISECCKNRRKLRGKYINKPTAYGYKWKFEDGLNI